MNDPEAPDFDPADTPRAVRLGGENTTLTLEWHDAAATTRAAALREACRCAWCSRARIEGRPPRAMPDIAIAEIMPMGRYAAHIAFTDGHRKGVFPWSYLRRLATTDPALTTDLALREQAA